MDVVAMSVRVGVQHSVFGHWRNPAQETAKVHDPESNQHHRDSKIHEQSKSGVDVELCSIRSLLRDDEVQENQRSAYDKNGQRVTNSPNRSHPRRFRDIALAADDRADCDHVIGIGGVAHSKEEAQRDDRDKANHWL